MREAIQWTLAFVLSFIVVLMPMPSWLHAIMPPWTLLLLFYALVRLRAMWVGVAIFLLGMTLDVMQGRVLGEQIFAFTLSLWLTQLDTKLAYQPAMDRQVLWVGAVCMLYQLSLLSLDAILLSLFSWQHFLEVLLSILLSALVWPWLAYVFDATLTSAPLRGVGRIV